MVLDDADVGVAVNCAVQGAYYSTGQRCTASSYGPREQGTYAREFYATVKTSYTAP